MNYDQAIKHLFSLSSFEREGRIGQGKKNFDLEGYRAFLEHLDNPQNGLKYIHVAGSKGKGSTCNFIAAGLEAQGYKIGLFTSPCVRDFREVMQVNGEWISEGDFVELFAVVKNGLDSFDGSITYFEFVTTLAFFYFKRQKVDYVVLEVGLGGTHDATNVVDPVITVLTQVELEHTNILGNTIEEVLENKLGIMKLKIPMIISWQKFDLRKQIDSKAEELNVEVQHLEDDFAYQFEKISLFGTEFQFDGATRRIALIGEAYIKSCLTALKVLREFEQDFDEVKFWKAAKEVKMPARFEIFEREDGGCIVFDMAHTLFGAKFLREALEQVFKDGNFVFLISVLKDKNSKGFFENLVKDDQVILTQAAIERALPAEELAAEVGGDFAVESNPQTAFKNILKNIKKDETLIVTGSHFLMHDLYPLI